MRLGAPDWVCEVRSPSTASTHRVDTLQASFRAGVPHCWLLDPAEGTLEVYRRTALAFEVNELLGDDG